jgi:signal transduction histidine kinase/CheY-like chemotaxis protein
MPGDSPRSGPYASPVDSAGQPPSSSADASTEVAISRIAFYTRMLFTFGLPVMLGTFALRLAQGRDVRLVAWMIGCHTLATLALWWNRKHPRRAAAVAIAGLFVTQVFTLLAFGPIAGIGMLVTLELIVALIHFGRRGALVVLVASCLLTMIVGQALNAGLAGAFPPMEFDRSVTWIRTAVVTLFLSMLVLFTFDRILSALRTALEDAKTAQRTEAIARREQAETAVALARARELETVGRLAGGVAHDFNNALTVILACASELARDPTGNATRELAVDIERAARAAAATTRQLLTFAKKRPPGTASCDPSESLRESLANLRRLLPADIELDAKLEPTGRVALDAGSLLQVVVNLVLNARDASTSGGTIDVRTKREGRTVLVEVEDRGEGMADTTKARLFEPFFSTKGGAGSGLGLAMVKATAEAAGGGVRVESELGRGTSIRLELPAVERAETTPRTGVRRLDGLRVLVVEDEPEIQRALRRSLEHAGASVSAARSADEALAIIEQSSELDFLCTDGVLVGGTALPVIEAFRARFPNAPVLLCSGHVPEELELRGLLSPEHERLPKPFTGDDLVRTVARLMG